MQYVGTKHDRKLVLYNNLLEGKSVNVKEAAEYYSVSTKSIKRDIEDIRSFLAEKAANDGEGKTVIYDRAKNNYYLTANDHLTAQELFAVSKVLLDSRAFCKNEFMKLMDKMIDRCAFENDKEHIEKMLANEKFHYCEVGHKKEIINTIWELSQAIKNHNRIKLCYERLTEPKVRERVVEPVGIMFSDFYFYLAAFIPEKNTKNPTIYRIDRIKGFKVLEERFSVPYRDRFEEGEFRKRVQFMYGGDLVKLELKYTGESCEAITDRLPTAEIVNYKDGVYTIKAEVFGRGIKPWILSQADKIEIVRPAELREEIKELVKNIYDKYFTDRER